MLTPSAPQLIVPLDHCDETQAIELVSELSGVGVTWFKVGLELYTLAGPQVVKAIKSVGVNVFLDLKLYDIPNTVAQTVKAAAFTGADLLTVHCAGGARMLQAAQDATRGTPLSLLGVTVLTSFGPEDLPSVVAAWGGGREEIGSASLNVPRSEIALCLAKIAAESGLPGVVCSVSDLSDGRLRRLSWKRSEPFFVTPGIRNEGHLANDQKSVATVTQALKAGSTHLVVGRPITASLDRAKAAGSILKQLSAYEQRARF